MGPLDERIRSKQIIDRTKRSDVRTHEGAEPSDPPIDFEPEESATARHELHMIKPWHKRVLEWIMFGHKMWAVYAVISGITVASHAYIHGIVTGKEVKDVVKAALDQAIEEKRISKSEELSRLASLETQMTGLPQKAADTAETVGKQGERINAVEQLAQKTEHKVDSYLIRAR